jgi:hypothetical protein
MAATVELPVHEQLDYLVFKIDIHIIIFKVINVYYLVQRSWRAVTADPLRRGKDAHPFLVSHAFLALPGLLYCAVLSEYPCRSWT